MLLLSACAGPTAEAPANTPTLELSADVTAGEAPLVVHLNAETSIPANAERRILWNVVSIGASGGSQSRSYVFKEPGSYRIIANATAPRLSASDELTVEVAERSTPDAIGNEDPAVSLTLSATDPAAPREVAFLAAASDPGGDPLTYTLDFGDGTRTQKLSGTHTYEAPGFYVATFIATDDSGGASFAEAEVTLE